MEFFIFPLCMSESWVDSPNKSDHKSSQLCVMAEEDSDAEIRRSLDVVQSMIDISAERLQGLRTQCATSVELTRQEIRTLEVSLYFAHISTPFLAVSNPYLGQYLCPSPSPPVSQLVSL